MDQESFDERVRARAYALWERDGRPEGREKEHWAQAEAQVRAEDLRQGGAQTAPAAAPEAPAASAAAAGPARRRGKRAVSDDDKD